MKLLLSLDGRVSRSTFWLCVLGLFVGTLIIGFLGSQTLLLAWQVLVLWPCLAISVKRWHDRDKSGWWVLINLIPVIGGLWALIENGFLKGSDGKNRFGADPLAA